MPLFLNSSKKQIIAILSSSILIHIFIILVTGAWWDDWKFYVNDFSKIYNHYVSAGRTDAYWLI